LLTGQTPGSPARTLRTDVQFTAEATTIVSLHNRPAASVESPSVGGVRGSGGSFQPGRKEVVMSSGCTDPAIPVPRRAAARRIRDEPTSTGLLLAGRYRLTELIGRGGAATVWRAYDEVLAREVAVKQLPAEHPYGLAEVRIAARVRHPNVAAVHDLVERDGLCWMVMDYYGADTLAAVLRRRRRLPPPVVAALGLQLLAALRAVHEAGVVHCDVQPANLLLGKDGRLVLIDFGIAEHNGGDASYPGRWDGNVVGSPAYMAPELVRGEPPRPPVDLWSLGAILYAAIEGRPPFTQADPVATLTAVLQDPPAPVRFAGNLEPLLSQLLLKEPTRRPAPDAIQAALRFSATRRDAAIRQAAQAAPAQDEPPAVEMPLGTAA
jgi:serine/threonine protein kinase